MIKAHVGTKLFLKHFLSFLFLFFSLTDWLSVSRGADHKSVLFFFARMQLIQCHHKSRLSRSSPGNHLLCLPFLFICSKQPTARTTAYLSAILVNHNFKGLGHVMSTHVLNFRLPPTLPDPQFFSPSSFSPSVWDYFMHD